MVNFQDLFNEPGPIYTQFTFMQIINFIFHTIFYYGISDKNIKKPDFNYILLFIIFHMIQVYVVKYFHANTKYYYAWAVLLVPSLLYLAYTKYQEKQSQAAQLNYWKYMASVQQQNSAPPAPPQGQFPTYGIQKGPQDLPQQPTMQQGGIPLQQQQQQHPPQYTQNNPVNPQLQRYGMSQDLNAQMHNTNEFASFSTGNYDPFSSPYTSL